MKTFAFAGSPALGAALSDALVAAGYESVQSIEQADILFTYYPLISQIEDAYFDARGFMQNARKGTYLVDLSPSTPDFARELSAVASVSDLYFVEAPLAVLDTTAADAFAQKANLACCIAGDAGEVTAVKQVLGAFVGAFYDMAEPGSAQLSHAAWALQRSARLLSAIEAEALYRAMRRVPTSAAAASTGVAVAAGDEEAAIIAAISEKRFKGTYTVEMFMADLAAALAAADDADLILPQAEACMNLLDMLSIIGGSDHAPAALALIYDEESAAAAQGLDWSRVEEYQNEMGSHSCGCGHCDDDDDDDFTGYADLFGDYSGN